MSAFSTNPAREALLKVARHMVPRLLTQACRDATSPVHGCFDRNWWHYKIRDFPSIILQQGGYALHLASRLDPWKGDAAALNQLAAASCLFWNGRAQLRGAFEEYYPWEQGYPPLAFSTLAVLKLHFAGVVASAEIARGALIAADQLKKRLESQAANQQVAGLAALAGIRKAFPEFVSESEFESVSAKTLALQHEEGWFVEYDGPDLGYLSVTIDCLWDLFDFTNDPGFKAAARRALLYIGHFVDVRPAGAGLHNARNTDYLVPYGIARFASDDDPAATRAPDIFARLYNGADEPEHFFAAVDDRYFSHYIGHSILRSLLEKSPPVAGSAGEGSQCLFLEGSGHVLRRPDKRCGGILSLRKGGILTLLDHSGREASDYGWIVTQENRQFVSHWWSNQWAIRTLDSNRFEISGSLFPHQEHLSGPWKHMALRLASLAMGRRIIAWLKKLVIFKNRTSSIQFHRQVQFMETGALIEDTFSNIPPDAQVEPAPRASKRHVASADSFQREDLALIRGFRREEVRKPGVGSLRISLSYFTATE